MRRNAEIEWLWRVMGLLAVLGIMAARAQAAGDIVAGPMVGHVTEKSARIWLQLAVAKKVTITCVEDRGEPVSEVGMDVEGTLPFTCDIPLNNLKPNHNYRIEVKLDGELVKLPGPELVIRTPPPAGEEAAFSAGFGSQISGAATGSEAGGGSAFKAAAALNPRAFLFLGDSVTLPAKLQDYPTKHRDAMRLIAQTYSKVRQQPDLQPLLRTTACYSLWNDRDFGAVDSNKDWVFKNESWAVFQRFWPNPDWGTPENPGCYFTFTIGDVDFFMLDSRMYRDADKDPNKKTMLGAAQLAWLKKGLQESKATFKIIGCASEMLTDYGQGDTWAAYPEQRDFLKWLSASKITGALFISGGRRLGEISALKPEESGCSYPLFEISSAGLTGKVPEDPKDAKNAQELVNGHRQGTAVSGNQFATLDFGGLREHRFVTLRVRDQDAKVKLEQTLFATQLK